MYFNFCLASSLAAHLHVYLVDVVTGNILFNTDHKRASGPVHLVHAENWIVVSTIDRFYIIGVFKSKTAIRAEKILDHSGVFIRDFPSSPFSILIHTIVAQMPLLREAMRQRVERGNSVLRQRVRFHLTMDKTFILVL